MAEGSSSAESNSTVRLIIVAAVLLVCCCGGSVVSALVPLGEMMSFGKKHYNNQCDIALGPAPGTTTSTSTPTTTSNSQPESRLPRPTANPFALLTFAADDPDATNRDRLCARALRVQPVQDEAWQEFNTGSAVMCAADLAVRYPEAGGTATMADYVRDVTFSASIVGSTGQCAPVRAPAPVATENCGDPTIPVAAVILPGTVGEQMYCGQLVDPLAASPGDLVFWDRDKAAPQGGVSLGGRELITVESGRFVRLTIPEGAEIQIRRVLGETK